MYGNSSTNQPCCLPVVVVRQGKASLGRFVIVKRQQHLFEIVVALAAVRGLAGGLDRLQQQRNDHAHDGDHNQQLDDGETVVRYCAWIARWSRTSGIIPCEVRGGDVSHRRS